MYGDVNIGGAKNAAVAILPATILAGGKCLIENLPCISDVMASLQILSELGASIRMVSRSTYEIDTARIWTVPRCPMSCHARCAQATTFSVRCWAVLAAGQVAMPGRLQSGPASD